MNDSIVSRQAIAHQADRAAALHAQAGEGAQLPQNPYCPRLQPEHHEQWAASFARALHNYMAPEAEASA